MLPKTIKQSLKYNELLMPKEHRRTIDTSNFDLWNEITTINTAFPDEQIFVEHHVKEFGHYYGIDLKLLCDNPVIQRHLDEAYETHMQIPRFRKHDEFDSMVGSV